MRQEKNLEEGVEKRTKGRGRRGEGGEEGDDAEIFPSQRVQW